MTDSHLPVQQYRLVYDKSLLRRKIIIITLGASVLCVTEILTRAPRHFLFGIVCTAFFVLFLAFLVQFQGRKKSIVMDAERMRFSYLVNYPLDVLPTHLKWSEFQAIHYFSPPRPLSGSKFLLFRDKCGKWHVLFLMIRARYLHVGENHEFSFDELLHGFYGDVREVSEEEKKGSP